VATGRGQIADLTRLRHSLAALVERSRPVAAETDVDQLLLVFEELVSNGLRHGRPPVRVAVAAIPTGWLLDVSDAAADSPPVPAHHREPVTGGMGLSLVAGLSAAHGWIVDRGRKHIWARVDARSLTPGSGCTVIPAPRIPA
jgi:signal transduction histidine kinase